MKQKTVCVVREIHAFDIDSSMTNDVESFQHDNETPEKRKGKLDKIFLIDEQLNLIKYEVGDQACKKISEVSLIKFDNIRKKIEPYLKQKFLRMGVTDRCLTIEGWTMNYHSGVQWKTNVTESVPFSNL